jgi:DHA1 family multidrug resistance protein-like MFS transporter
VATAIGRLQAVQILAAAVGPLLGGQVADHVGIRASFLVTAVLCAISFVVLSILYQEERTESGARARRAVVSIRSLLALPAFLPLMGILLLAQVINRGFSPVIPLFIPDLDPNAAVASTAGTVLSISLFVSAVVASQIGRFAVRVPPAALLIPFLVVGLIATAPMAAIGTVWQLLLLNVLNGVATGAIITLCYAAASTVIPSSSRTTAFSMLGSATSIANALGPFGAGAIASYSIRTVFVADSALYLPVIALGVVAALTLSRLHPKQQELAGSEGQP